MLNGIARPFGMVLMFLYTLVSNYGVAIMLFAIVIKAILLPFQMKSKRGMIQQARLQPKIAELQKKHGTNKAKLNEETMKLYKEEGVNPASGCIWGILPLPIMLALFQVIRQPITIMMGVAAEQFAEITEKLTSMGFVSTLSDYYVQIDQSQFITKHFSVFQGISSNLREMNFNILPGLNMGLTPQWDFIWNGDIEKYGTWLAGFIIFLIPLLSGGVQFLASALNRKLNPPAMVDGQAKSMNTMMMLMPLLSIYIAFITPAALGFYWTISTVLQIVQDVWLTKVYTKRIEAEEAIKNEERARKEAELEAKRLETERKKAEGLVERNPNTAKRKKQKSDKQEQIGKAVEWQKKNAPVEEDTTNEPGRVGKRRYARGRAYDPDRYLYPNDGSSDILSEDADADEGEGARKLTAVADSDDGGIGLNDDDDGIEYDISDDDSGDADEDDDGESYADADDDEDDDGDSGTDEDSDSDDDDDEYDDDDDDGEYDDDDDEYDDDDDDDDDDEYDDDEDD
ncbi:MAG: membrane protein insertase YidC [Oscillospiraceae bacterium]|nr:membrane protein insertase YidC [Oscillospiraceae bacterium]